MQLHPCAKHNLPNFLKCFLGQADSPFSIGTHISNQVTLFCSSGFPRAHCEDKTEGWRQAADAGLDSVDGVPGEALPHQDRRVDVLHRQQAQARQSE